MFKKISFLFFICFLSLASFSQRVLTRAEYIQKYRPLAVHEMQRCGIPASIKLAQACLESGNGNSELSRRSNNHFGIKCKSNWKGKRVFHDDDMRNECFRKYNTVEESFQDHSDFLVANPRYASLFQLKITDYKGWARGLKRAGYATAPHYAESLIKIIEEYKLYVYDDVANDAELNMITTTNHTQHDTRELINPFPKRKVVFRNGLKSIVVKSGDTPQSIADEFNVKAWELYKYNDLKDTHRLQVNEILYIEPKRSKALHSHSFHTFAKGESMHYVSQKYGVRLKRLYRLNRMRFGEVPVAGTKLYLRKKAPKR